MKVAFLVPGSGNMAYCQNCLRDISALKAMRSSEHEVFVVPLYLPTSEALPASGKGGSPVFYGAINCYLSQKIPFYSRMPGFIKSFFDSESALSFAMRFSGATKASSLEDLTMSMLLGEDGRQKGELDRLVLWIEKEKPDIIHISNALLLGVAKQFKEKLGIPLVCTFQDETQWIDGMSKPAAAKIYALITERCTYLDAMVSVSSFYSGVMSKKLSIASENFKTIYPGIDESLYQKSSLPADPPQIVFLSRMSEDSGLGILVDALIEAAGSSSMKGVALTALGGASSEDRRFIGSLRRKLERKGLGKTFNLIWDFEFETRMRTLSSSSLFCVPKISGSAFAYEMLEAFAAGVPALVPDSGAYSEMIGESGAGKVYSPNKPAELASRLEEILGDREGLRSMSEKAIETARAKYSSRQAAEKYLELFAGVLSLKY